MNKFLVFILLLLASAAVRAADLANPLFKTHGKFEEVRDMLVISIENRGLKINNVNHIAEMLERTGKDLGAARPVFAKGEQYEFCSAVISRKMMEADPHSIILCPYIISIYSLPNDGDTIYLAYRKAPPTRNKALKKALADVDTLLSGIIRETLQ